MNISSSVNISSRKSVLGIAAGVIGALALAVAGGAAEARGGHSGGHMGGHMSMGGHSFHSSGHRGYGARIIVRGGGSYCSPYRRRHGLCYF